MREKQKSTLARRTVLSAIGTGLTTGVLGTEATAQQGGRSQYALEQNDGCVPIRPIRGRLSADEFYDFELPEQYVTAANGAFVGDTTPYSSAGTMDLQRPRTSIAFLYRDPGGLYLVFVHGSVRASDAGSVTFRISGLPEDGEWIVKDDRYRDPDTGELAASNYDRWDVDGTDHRIDWTWGSAGTDGGVFGELGDDFEIVVRPAFNEAAALFGEHYEGTVTDWEFLSGPAGGERISLDLDEPIRIRTGRCAGGSRSNRPTRRNKQQTEQQGRVEQEQEVEIEQEQRTRQQETERGQQSRQQETERVQEQDQEKNQEQDQEIEQVQEREIEQSQTRQVEQEGEIKQKQEAEIEQDQEIEGAQDQEDDGDDKDDKDDEDDEERGKGHEKSQGKGHEQGRGKGHEKHGDDDDGDNKGDDDADDDGGDDDDEHDDDDDDDDDDE